MRNVNDGGHISPFDAIRRVDEAGREYWSARELSKLLGYTRFDKFSGTLAKAEEACRNSGQAVSDHMSHTRHMIATGKGAKRPAEDVLLSRYGAYLVVQNADPDKPIVALGQTYFAVQTRRQEIADELSLAALSEEQKRLIFRDLMSTHNLRLAHAARLAGVIEPRDFAAFEDHGYMGMYAGRRENDIHRERNLKPKEKILDRMGSEELADNVFRAAQTDAKLRRDQVTDKEQANATHFQVGQEIREAIARLGGTMPEDLPTPEKSIQELQREEQKRIEAQRQPSLFDKPEE